MTAQMINIENMHSAGIAAEMREQGITEIKFIGAFDPVEEMANVCEADAKIRIYQFQNGCYVADTNGDPIWEQADLQAWGDLMAQYGVDL